MKKIMMIAAVAAMIGGVQAATTPCQRTTGGSAAWAADVYQIRMSLKTTTGVGTTLTPSGTLCNRGGGSTNIYRKATSLTLDGWIYQCTNVCTTIHSGSSLLIWETTQKAAFTSPAITWQGDFPHVMGQRNADAEAYFKFNGVLAPGAFVYNASAFFNISELWCAGQGKYDCKAARYTQFSGNCAGKGTAPYDVSRTAKACDPSKILLCTQLASSCTVDPTTASDTAIFGTWSIRYNATASAKYFKDGTLTIPAPTVQYPNYVKMEAPYIGTVN